MKRIFNKTFLTVALAMAMLFALVGGLLFARHTQSADADEAKTTMSLTTDAKSFVAGSEFTLTATFTTARSEELYALDVFIGPKNNDTSFDVQKTKWLTFSDIKWSGEYITTNYNTTASVVVNDGNVNSSGLGGAEGYSKAGNVHLSVSRITGKALKSYTTITVTMKVKIAEEVPAQTHFDITTSLSKNTYVAYTGSIKDNPEGGQGGGGLLQVNMLSFDTKEPSTDNTLKTLKVGQGDIDAENGEDLITDNEEGPFDITVKDPSKDLNVYFETNDGGASVEIKKKGGVAVEAEDGKASIPLTDLVDDSGSGDLTITVTAEDGSTKEYTVHVDVVGAMLETLIPSTETKGDSNAEAKFANNVVFASDKTDYTVNVPADATTVKFTLTVKGYHTKSDLTLSKTGSCTLDNGESVPIIASTVFTVSGIEEGDTISIKVEAENEGDTAEKTYTITFDVVEVDVTISQITVKGHTSQKEFKNNATKATAEEVDYYYMIAGETKAASDITVTATSQKAQVTIDGTETKSYTGTKESATEGEKTITVVAEAGNKKDYKLYLKNYNPLKLKEGIDADFMFESTENVTEKYRRTYKEKGLTHGVDDTDFDRIVLGQVRDLTTVTEFLGNFDATVVNNIKIFDKDGGAVMDLNQTPKIDPDNMDNADEVSIGTGWYIQYWVEGSLEETIYISVLGDVTGDGFIDGSDTTAMSRYLRGEQEFDDVEVRLAGYVDNSIGNISSVDVSALSSFIMEEETTDQHFYNPED